MAQPFVTIITGSVSSFGNPMTGHLTNSTDFMEEFDVSRRTVARDLDFLRDEEPAPLAYDDARHGFRLTDETYTFPPVRISRREAFSFALARKLLAHYEVTPLHLDMRSVLDKIAESLEGDEIIADCRMTNDDLFQRMGLYQSTIINRQSSMACTPTTFSPTMGTGT